VSRSDIPWLVIVVLLLAAGLLIGRQFTASLSDQETEGPATAPERTFRLLFWEDRGLDLAVQIGLILGGALSIAALLPGRRESSE
jgi:hypothetical protein